MLRCETGRFRLRNGPFQTLKQAVSQAKTIHIETLYD